MTLPDHDLSVHFDYKSKTTTASLVNPYPTTGASNYSFKVYNEKGAIIQSFNLTGEASVDHQVTSVGSGTFGLRWGQSDSHGGYDSSIARQDLSGVWVGYTNTLWEMSSEYDSFDAITTFENTVATSPGFTLDARNDVYVNIPLLITGGDAVVYGAVSSVTGDNAITLTYDRSLASYTGYNLANSICEVISGANLGDTFSIRSHTLGQSSLFADITAWHLSGQIIKVMPYRNVTSYSGYSYTGSTNSNLGSGGILGRFGLNANIANKVGSIHYTSGTVVSIDGGIHHPLDDTFYTGFSGTKVALKNDSYMRNVLPGDVIYFNPASNPSAESTGVVLYTGTHGVPAEGDFTVTYWPSREPHASSYYKVSRKNQVELYSFPNLDRDYLCMARGLTVGLTGQKFVTKVSTPSVTMDFSANEYESLFNSIPESSHFHLGSIYLSNGQTLSEDTVGSNGVKPLLYFSGQVTNGSPLSPTVVLRKEGFSTQDPSAAHLFNGMYFKDGTMTLSSNTSFTASETLVCKAIVTYGSIKIDRVFSIPVQPSV